MKLHLDFETRSEADLNKVGAWAYASHPSTEIICMGWGFVAPGERVRQITRQECLTPRFHGPWSSNYDNVVISAHNAAFEYAIWNCILHKRFGWPAMWEPNRWTCTMARAAMVGLPLSLDELGRVLSIKTPKDLEGRRTMLQLSKPLGQDALGDPIYDEAPEKFERLYAYNANDVRSEMEVDALLPELPESERRIWELDLVMNRRGIQIDLIFAAKASAMSKELVGPLNDRLRVITNGAVDKATQIPALKDYLKNRGVEVPTKYVAGEEKEALDKVGVTELLARADLPPDVRQAVEIRRQVSKTTSTAKYAKAVEMACRDGRVRGVLQYHGAHTGRWAGRLLQAHNFPKGFDEADAQRQAVDLINRGDLELFSFLYGDRGMDALSDALRGMIVAGPGKELVSADYNAIEARGVFWLAGEKAALAAYARGESPYLDMANYIYRRSDITKKGAPQEYDLGKRTVLGCGFGMGWEKFRDNTYAETAKIGKPVRLSDELAKRAVDGYREKYAAVPRMWYEIEAAALAAVRTPGQCYAACGGKVLWGMSVDRRFLVCRLPSGRYLWYWKPSTQMAKTPWGADKLTLFYWGKHPKTGEWCQLKTYGGALTENVTQAVARDIMANGMLKAEAAGFEMILTVHDELLAEATQGPQGAKKLDEFMALMCGLPTWAKGFPVVAEGWVGARYRK